MGDGMRLEVLHVPDCPNAAVLTDRLDRLIADPGVVIEHRVIRDAGEAAAFGMSGSPTLLIDGVDPFARPGLSPSLSCRLYFDDEGAACGAPTAEQLARALAAASGRAQPPTR